MDIQTRDFYRDNAAELAWRYERAPSPFSAEFERVFRPKGRILDVGCGSGRDLALLAEKGFDVFGLDSTPEFVSLAQELHPALRGRVAVGQLPELLVPFEREFDGVLCSAVLMHLQGSDIPAAAAALRMCLRSGGRLMISVSGQRCDLDTSNRDPGGRLFTSHTGEFLQSSCERARLDLIRQYISADGMDRVGVQWITQIYEAR